MLEGGRIFGADGTQVAADGPFVFDHFLVVLGSEFELQLAPGSFLPSDDPVDFLLLLFYVVRV